MEGFPMKKLHVAVTLGLAALVASACSDNTAPGTRTAAPSQPRLTTVVTGAAFTTVNENVDGTGHCKNGNPGINCNIYDGKQYVWLNGGPSTAYVGDGTYFFAVLSPGGQPNPNDGGAGNLSDDFDAYTNRTFSVTGGVVSYGGSHDFSDNEIRLLPYADTPNPGGVYIMAICSLADGYPATPSHCKYDAFKVQEGNVVQASALTILKDATLGFDKKFAWTIAKDVDKTTVTQVGGSVTFTYTITVTHDGGTISNVNVSGTVAVFNPNVDQNGNTVAVQVNGITDLLSDGTNCTITGGGSQSLTQFETDFTYSCNLSALPEGELDNTATVSWPTQTLANGTTLNAGTANFLFLGITFTENDVDESITVTDSFAGALGTVTVGDANPKTFTYQRTIAVGSGCSSYDNTATFTTNDTGATGSASQTVTVCGPTPSGALTMGFWKGPNGNALIQYYCAPAGKTSLATYLSGLGGGSGPFADAAGKSCLDLVAYVDAILNNANAADMNVMLRAQMLATALDVYFSSYGYSTAGIGNGKNQIKPPSNFLPNGGIGTFSVDLTAVCPAVASTPSGSALCEGGTPSTDAVAAGAVPLSPMTIQQILDFAATTPSPFNGSTTTPIWYGGNQTKEEILKNIFDQINNNLAFSGP
jgi:hypothetical protein